MNTLVFADIEITQDAVVGFVGFLGAVAAAVGLVFLIQNAHSRRKKRAGIMFNLAIRMIVLTPAQVVKWGSIPFVKEFFHFLARQLEVEFNTDENWKSLQARALYSIARCMCAILENHYKVNDGVLIPVNKEVEAEVPLVQEAFGPRGWTFTPVEYVSSGNEREWQFFAYVRVPIPPSQFEPPVVASYPSVLFDLVSRALVPSRRVVDKWSRMDPEFAEDAYVQLEELAEQFGTDEEAGAILRLIHCVRAIVADYEKIGEGVPIPFPKTSGTDLFLMRRAFGYHGWVIEVRDHAERVNDCVWIISLLPEGKVHEPLGEEAGPLHNGDPAGGPGGD